MRSGDIFDLGETLCSQVLGNNQQLAIENIEESDLDSHLASDLYALKSYIGIPVVSKGRVCGTLNFSSRSVASRKFSKFDFDVIKLMSVLIGSEFDRLEDRKKLESAFRNIEVLKERLRLTIDASPAAIITTNYDGLIIHNNTAAEKLFGYGKGELINRPVDILVPGNLRQEHINHRNRFSKRPVSRPMGIGKDFFAVKKNGQRIHVEIGLSPVDGPKGKNIICTLVDLTSRKEHEATILRQSQELKAANNKLSDLARTDVLTGLANRRCFLEQLELMLKLSSRNGTPLSVIILDVDNFKKFNDNFGHQAGDEALKLVSASLAQVVRGSDLAARYGGEEFAVALPNTDEQGSVTISERVREVITEQTVSSNTVTASFGVATVLPAEQNQTDVNVLIDAAIRDADRALYHSKNTGKNRVTHFRGLNGGN